MAAQPEEAEGVVVAVEAEVAVVAAA